MNRYRHFGDEFEPSIGNSSAILPELDTEEPFPLEFSSQVPTYPSKFNKFKIFFYRRTKLERYLSCLIILLLTFIFIIIITSLSYFKENSNYSLCLKPSCIQLSNSIYSGMNQSVDPCEDFHEFVCGQWIKKNLIPKSHSAWAVIKELAQTNMIILKNILEQTSISTLSTAEKQSITYYQSCMDKVVIEELKIRPFEDFFQINLNITLQQWITIDKSQLWQQLFIHLTKTFSIKYGFSCLLPLRIEPDEKNSTWNNIHVKKNKIHFFLLKFDIFLQD